MPLYEWHCETCGHSEQTWATIAERDQSAPRHRHEMKRLPGGTGMLWAEEGRPRYIEALGQTVTSESQRKRLAARAGLVESGNNVPNSVKRNPRSTAMKRFLGSDKKGRWV